MFKQNTYLLVKFRKVKIMQLCNLSVFSTMFDLQITDMQFNDLNTQDLKYKV